MLRKTDEPHVELRSTMDRHQFIDAIREFGIWTIVEMFIKPEAQVMMGFREGLNIAGWEAKGSNKGYVLFVRDAPREAVIYVNTDSPDIIARHLAELDCPALAIGRTEAGRDDVAADLEARYRASVAHLLPDDAL